MEKKYKLGFVVGRFQPLHLGHQAIIDRALELCEKVVVLVGSAEYGKGENFDFTDKNPLSYNIRRHIIYRNYSIDYTNGRLDIVPLVQIGAGNSPIWGNYIMNSIKFRTGKYPDVYISGTEPDRDKWLGDWNVDVVEVDRQNIPISATQVRKALINNESLSGLTSLTTKEILTRKADFG